MRCSLRSAESFHEENLSILSSLAELIARSTLAQSVAEGGLVQKTGMESTLENIIYSSTEVEPFLNFMQSVLYSFPVEHHPGMTEHVNVMEQINKVLSQGFMVSIEEMRCAIGCYKLVVAEELVLCGHRSGDDLMDTLERLHFLHTKPPAGLVVSLLAKLQQLSHSRGLLELAHSLGNRIQMLSSGAAGLAGARPHTCTYKLLGFFFFNLEQNKTFLR